MTQTVKVPEQFEPIFAQAEKTVGSFFANLKRDPSKGIITIAEERYILIRGESIFQNLRDKMNKDFGNEITDQFLYDLAKTIGWSDAVNFVQKLDLKDPVQKLSAGPVHFSHSGWAFVDILDDSSPTPDDNYLLVYNHPNTFESEQYIKKNEKSTKPVCLFSAGYSAGWCSYSFGVNVDATEILCVAKGDKDCRFVMAPPKRLEQRTADYKKKYNL